MSGPVPSVAWFVRRIIAYRPLLYAGNALCWILFHLWPLLPGLLARAFLNRLTGQVPTGLTVTTLAALAAAAGAARVAIVLGAHLTGTPWRFATRELLQRNLVAAVLARTGATVGAGEAVSLLRDDVAAAQEAIDFSFDVLAFCLYAISALAVLFSVDARVTLLVFLPVMAVVGLAHAARVRLVRAREESRAATARVTGAIGDIFGAAQAIQAAGAGGRAVAYLRRLGEERQRAALWERLQGLWLDSIFQQTANLGAGLVLLVAAGRMRAGRFPVGDFALFASYLLQVVTFTSFLGYLINTYRQAGVSFRRLLALLNGAPPESLVAYRPDAPAAAPAATPLERVEVANLTYRHPGSGRGIAGISFQMERGSFTVITGPVGAGKSTLLRAVLGLLAPQAGAVRWNGNPVPALLPPMAAYTPQVPVLLSGSLGENILLGWEATGAQLEKAIRSAVLEADLAGMPEGLETRVGARGMKLSGGQVQRTAAARMFVREPELLVFDDLSSALDGDTEALLWQRLRERGATVLAVSHRPGALAMADQIIRLNEHGGILAPR